jgi:hypothetical protein
MYAIRLKTLAALVFVGAVAALSLPDGSAADKKSPKLSAEMKDFMKHLNGTEKGVDAALKKHVAEGVDTLDIKGIQVREPKVTQSEMKDGMTCYTMEVKSGILERTYRVCWKDQKIREIKQLSIK